MHIHRLVLLLFLMLTLVQCSSDSRSGKYGSYSDNLEAITEIDGSITGRDADFRIGNVAQLVRDTSKSGKNSLRLDPKHPYGLNYKIPNVNKDESVDISVWYSGPGKLVLVASHKDAKYFYRKSGVDVPANDEWRELQLSVSIPPSMNREDLNIYVWNPGKDPVYVDDFKFTYKKYKSYPSFSTNESLHLLIDTMDMISLERKRDEAFANGILETQDQDFVNGIMYYNDTLLPIEIRLKGDWLDHLEGRKWSFRIKVRKQNTWKNMTAFSLQTPLSRDFLNEYVAHELYEKSDMLTTRYGFVPITLNGTSLGVYAWEEHFDKQLIESSNRREGPILKFEESLFWTSQKVFIQDTQYFRLPFLEASDVVPFKMSRTLADPTLRDGFTNGFNLMNQNRLGLKNVSEIFDVERLATYYALMDLTRGFHGLAWHNQRHYYNPVLCRLEPIFFDAYTEGGVVEHTEKAIAGMFNVDPNARNLFETLFWMRNYQDSVFLKHYIIKLAELSDPLWINDFLQEKNNEISRYEGMIKKEFVDYKYDRGFILENAKMIRQLLPEYINLVKNKPDYASFDPLKINYRPYSNIYDPRFPASYVNVYLQDSIANEYRVKLDNFYPLDIEVIGYGANEKIMDRRFSEVSVVGPFKRIFPVSELFSVPPGNKYVFFRVRGHDERFATPILPYPAAQNSTPEQELFSGLALPDVPFIQVEGVQMLINSGKHVAYEPLVIPAGYTLVFEAGCEIDFRNGSFLISKSPIVMNGTKDNPIRIISSDNSANGFTVLQAKGHSYLNFVEFIGLNTLSYKGWNLTGAVNFYESDVDINEVLFANNVCEDALNTIRSEFIVMNSNFTNTFADAFDSDFCTGLVEKVKFNNIGNDAIDFSGSVVDIKDCLITKAGDKGVSAGEGSTLTVYETRIEVANIGFASKDNSAIVLDNCSANQVNYGLLALQKKPEYGPASIKTSGFNSDGAKTLFLIERFSKLNLNGTIIQGNETKLAELFY